MGVACTAERIRSAVQATPIEYNGRIIHMTVSLGFAVADNNTLAEYSGMYALAASALTAAKRQGRNRAVIQCVEPHPEKAPTAST
jgi:GGDEF domain-containing protein